MLSIKNHQERTLFEKNIRKILPNKFKMTLYNAWLSVVEGKQI
jgi:hypothetical protein